jgi:hypothetical protein
MAVKFGGGRWTRAAEHTATGLRIHTAGPRDFYISNPTKPEEIQHKWRCPGHERSFGKMLEPADFTRARARSTGHVTSNSSSASAKPSKAVRTVIPVDTNHTCLISRHSVHYTHRILFACVVQVLITFHQTVFRRDARTAKQANQVQVERGEAADLRVRGCFARCGLCGSSEKTNLGHERIDFSARLVSAIWTG